MSHTIGQAKQNNQQSTPASDTGGKPAHPSRSNFSSSQAEQDSTQPESSTPEPISLLSDADYEFLFNQLLEGVAHGWHDRRIVKFFKQLGDRGEQVDWVAWLDRFRVKLLKLPIQSKNQLGAVMIRLGELTQSATEVSQIGAASQRIGRELLFGNGEVVVWEYDGPDLVPEVPTLQINTESELAEKLPTDFTELSSTQVEETELDLAAESIVESTDNSSTELASPSPLDLTPENPNDTVESPPEEELEAILSIVDSIPSEPELETVESEAESTSLPEISSYNEEFEFALDSQQVDESAANATKSEISELSEPVKTSPSISVNQQEIPATELASELSLDSKEQELTDAIEALDPISENQPSSVEINDIDDSDPVAIDMQQVIHLIQEDDELAQQISQKLNAALVKPSNTEAIEQSSNTVRDELDESSLELIEGWFNLGLKQVSAGEFTKAIASWEKALKINPNLSEAWHNRGSALGRLGSYEAAVESFQSALEIDPQNYQAWNDRAHALYQLENWAEAVDSWSNAINIMPGNHLFWYNRGCALEQLEKWQDAIASYEKALEIKPDFQPGRSRYINLVADNSLPN